MATQEKWYEIHDESGACLESHKLIGHAVLEAERMQAEGNAVSVYEYTAVDCLSEFDSRRLISEYRQ